MSYRVGYCAQCETQIMGQGPDGRWESVRPNYRQVDLTFADGHRIRCPLCDVCMADFDGETVMKNIVHVESEAGSEEVKLSLKKRGEPKGIALAARARQGTRLGKNPPEMVIRKRAKKEKQPHGN